MRGRPGPRFTLARAWRASTTALCDTLEELGEAAEEARLVARLVTVCLEGAFERWIDTGDDLASCLDASVGSMRSVAGLFPPLASP